MIQWVDLLSLILKAHGDSLRELAAFLGDSELLELLEARDENELQNASALEIRPSLLRCWPPDREYNGVSPLEVLEQTLRDSQLPAVLEFYVWTYPFYRTLIELPIDLRSTVEVKTHPEFVEEFCDRAIHEAGVWTQSLRLSATSRGPAERITRTAWLRLRSEVFKRLGRRTLSTLPS